MEVTSSLTCLMNVDGINYKIDIKPKNGEKEVDLDHLKDHLTTLDDDIAGYDIFDDKKYILEIFDPNFGEFVKIDGTIGITDKAKLRARVIESHESEVNHSPNKGLANNNHYIADDCEEDMLAIKDFEEKKHLVNIVLKLHKDFPRKNHRFRNSRSSYIMDESFKLKEKFWSSVADEMSISMNKNYDGKTCMALFFGLLGQYQYVLRKFTRHTENKVQETWPFFKTFHHRLDSKLFARGLVSLKSNFDNTSKDGKYSKDHNRGKKRDDAYSRLEEDFNLLLSVGSRIKSFKSNKTPRAALWKAISVDMGDYDLPNSCMSALRWQKRFHELLRKYLEISSHISEEEKQAWPLYNLFSQIDIKPFLTIKDDKENEGGNQSPTPIDLSDSESEFVVIDEIVADDDDDDYNDEDEDVTMLDTSEEIDKSVDELIQSLLDKIGDSENSN